MNRESPLVSLCSGRHGSLLVRPRWPAKQVLIDPLALERLRAVQAALPAEIELILTRAFEPAASRLGGWRSLSRRLGILVFRLAYPGRRDEIGDIFGPNGHDLDGSHVDVSLAVRGRRLRLLPLSVFTPPAWQRRNVGRHQAAFEAVRAALVTQGFVLHRNATESHQIHCDLHSPAPRG